MANYDESLSARSISANLGQYEAARSGFFTLIVDDLDNLIRPTVDPDTVDDADDSVRIKRAQEYLKLNVVKSSVPTYTLKKLEYRRGNSVVYAAGTPDWSEGSITIDDVVGLNTKDIVYAWWYLAYNPLNDKGGRMVNYKKTCTLCEYTQDYELIRQWRLEGCWLSKVDDSEFDKGNDAKRQLTATLVYDRGVPVAID